MAAPLASSAAPFYGVSHATVVPENVRRRRHSRDRSMMPPCNVWAIIAKQRTDVTNSLSSWSQGLVSRGVCGVFCTLVVATSMGTGLAAGAAALSLPATPVTPYSQADQMQLGLVEGGLSTILVISGWAVFLSADARRIRPCPLDVNPNCVSTSSNNAGYAAPWIIPESSYSSAVQKIESAVLATQKNPEIVRVQDTREGTYIVAEADGLFGRDVMEFLVKNDVVTFRSMAKKVVYLYPFTTPIGDFGGQQKRLESLEKELGWSLPSFDNTFEDSWE